jgi:hypothetical protein
MPVKCLESRCTSLHGYPCLKRFPTNLVSYPSFARYENEIETVAACISAQLSCKNKFIILITVSFLCHTSVLFQYLDLVKAVTKSFTQVIVSKTALLRANIESHILYE